MRARNRLATTVLLIAMSVTTLAAAEAGSEGCDPQQDPNCFPTREECAEGGHDGVYINEEAVFPGAACVSDDGQEGVYVGGDPKKVCGTIAAAGVTVADSVEGDPNQCAEPPGVREWGYLTVRDGTRLRYTVVRPETDHPVPVALKISPYSDGGSMTLTPLEEGLLLAGYAIVGVNARGTGCSEGKFDVFHPYSDLYDVVEWAGAQLWSTADVGMIGVSAMAMAQLLAASTNPPSLRAIAPSAPPPDLYRDFAYPGGIPVFSGAWWLAGAQPVYAATAYPDVAQHGDAECFVNEVERHPDHDVPLIIETQKPYHSDRWEHYSAITWVDRIEVPVLACQSWQDDQTLSSTAWLDRIDGRLVWAVFTNGHHTSCPRAPGVIDLTVAFFDEFVHPDRHVGFDRIPHVQLWHESSGFDEAEPSWVTAHRRWPPRTSTRVLHLTGDGELGSLPAVTGARYWLYPLAATSQEATDVAEPEVLWTAPPTPGGYVAWTTPPLAEDVEIFGTGSLDLWLSSTAPDTDLQVTLTEVRPDGQEMYLRRGWLRGSQRALDEDASTPTRPVHTHREEDTADLPDAPTLVRVEIPPVNHVFRAGSAIRVIVDAPTGRTGYWQFGLNPTPAVNTIHTGPDHPSRLVLGVIPDGSAPADRPLPACGEVLRTPCRQDPLAVGLSAQAPDGDDDEPDQRPGPEGGNPDLPSRPGGGDSDQQPDDGGDDGTDLPAAVAGAGLPTTGGGAAVLAIPMIALAITLARRRARAH